MELNVNIDPEQINKMVADAILKSAIGEALKTAIERVLKDHPAEIRVGGG